MFDLKGKVALVTGASSGIGLAFVKELLQNGLKGVAMVDLDVTKGKIVSEDLTKVFGKDKVIFIQGDVCDKNQLEGAFNTTVKTFKQLDIVLNNAGIINEIEWEKSISVNLVGLISGSLLAAEKYFPKYKSESEAVILNTSSIVGLQPFVETPVYDATKAGVISFTRAFGHESRYKTTQVRMIAICPGVTDTPMPRLGQNQMQEEDLPKWKCAMDKSVWQQPEDVAKHAMNLIKTAPTSTVWLVDANKCTQIEFPNYCDSKAV